MNRPQIIKDKQRALQKELERIQSSCKHTHQSVTWMNDIKGYKWVCNMCMSDIRYPTTPELDKFIHS
jgi:hypothetical protein